MSEPSRTTNRTGRPPSAARRAAFFALCNLEHTNFRIHLEDGLHEICDTHGIAPRDRKLAYEITCGCIRHKTWLEHALSTYASRPTTEIDADLRWILLMGLYQILFLDRVTPYAAVNESVLLCHHLGHKGWASFANGILRHVVRLRAEPGFVRPVFDEPTIDFSHPVWLVDEYAKVFGARHVGDILAWNNLVPQRYARARTDVTALVAEVGMDIIEPAPQFGAAVVKVRDMATLLQSPAFQAGKLYIMQPWSVYTVAQLPLKDGDEVLDMCAAPGGKSLALADAARVQVTALDISSERTKVIVENARRCGVTTIKHCVLDARHCAAILGEGRFDAVLVDAPCTNLGVIQRHPEIRWRVQPEMMAASEQVQFDLLREGARCVKRGGYLLYAVCTTSEAETKGILKRVSAQLSDISMVTKELRCPGEKGTDGGFWALFRKNNG